MRELADRVTALFIDGRLGHFAAVQVRHGERQWQGGEDGGKHLETVAQHHQQIGTGTCQRVGKTAHAVAEGVRNRLWSIAVFVHRHPLGDFEPIRLDQPDCGAKSFDEMAAPDEKEQLEIRIMCNLFQERREMAVVGAGHRDDTDDAPHGPHFSTRSPSHPSAA